MRFRARVKVAMSVHNVEKTSLKKEIEQMKVDNKDLKKRMEKATSKEQRNNNRMIPIVFSRLVLTRS